MFPSSSVRFYVPQAVLESHPGHVSSVSVCKDRFLRYACMFPSSSVHFHVPQADESHFTGSRFRMYRSGRSRRPMSRVCVKILRTSPISQAVCFACVDLDDVLQPQLRIQFLPRPPYSQAVGFARIDLDNTLHPVLRIQFYFPSQAYLITVIFRNALAIHRQ